MSQFAKIFESIKETPANDKKSNEKKSVDNLPKTKTNAKAEGKSEKRSAQSKKVTVSAAEKPTEGSSNPSVSVTEDKITDSPAEQKAEAGNSLQAANSTKKSGKSSNKDYTQVLTYIRRDTHKQIKKALIDDPLNRDLSDLVEELLAEWIKKSD